MAIFGFGHKTDINTFYYYRELDELTGISLKKPVHFPIK